MKIKGKKILVTGGAGQLGEELIPLLLAEGAHPMVLDRGWERAPSICKFIERGLVQGIQADLTRASDLARYRDELSAVEFVVHLASVIEPGAQIDEGAMSSIQTNLVGTINLLERVKRCGFFCFASSMMVYGLPCYSPMDESHPTWPENTYGINKLAVEKLLSLWSLELRVPVAVLRFTSLYGPGRYSPLSRNRAIPLFIRMVDQGDRPTLFGQGGERRDYLFIRDAATAIIQTLQERKEGVFNVGSGQGVSIRQLTELIIQLSGKDFSPLLQKRDGEEEHDYTLDISRITIEMGFQSRFSLEEGLSEEIKWYREKGID